MNCGCILIRGTYPEWITRIEMCPLHEAAPKLLGACKAIRDGDLERLDSFNAIMDQVDAAIAKAEGREP